VPSLRFKFARLWFPLLGALLLAGCTDGDRVKTAAEIDEPYYREGGALLKNGRKQEALGAFLKVIDKRGADAPESHLSVGIIYAEHINDPLSAIYHYRRYLALKPNGPLTTQIRQRIDAATREFARTLPAQPLENQVQRVDLVAALDRLKQENETLKQQLADAKAGRGSVLAPASEPVPAVPAEAAPASSFNFSVDAMPTVRTRPVQAPTRPPAPAPARATPVTPPPKSPAIVSQPVAGNRRHTIQPGDTLSKISQQYYGNRTRVNDIFAANRGVMKSTTDLKPGMVLRIP
jgi:LysM repeat protein